MLKIRNSQRSDSELSQLIDYIEEKGPPKGPYTSKEDSVTQTQKRYFVMDRVLSIL